MELAIYKQITSWASDLDGLFTTQDLRIALNKYSQPSVYRNISELVESGDLIKIKRGFYATPEAKLTTVAMRLYPNSYISTGTILAAERIIGTIPERKIQVVQLAPPSSISTKLGTIEALSIAPKLFFGFERENNCFWATKEKAFLDACYYSYKRKSFPFDLDGDVNRSLLSLAKIKDYLKAYDRRFISYFWKNFWVER